MDTLKTGKSEGDNLAIIEKQKVILKKYNWKKVNKSHINKLLKVPELEDLIDSDKEQQREKAMATNIQKNITQNINILVIT